MKGLLGEVLVSTVVGFLAIWAFQSVASSQGAPTI